jgi:hypothetical protein
MARRMLYDAAVNTSMASDDWNDAFLAAARMRAQRVLEHVQRDGAEGAAAAIREMYDLSREADALGHADLAETARDGLAEAWSWRLGREAMDARVRLARLCVQVVRQGGKQKKD